MEIYQTKKQIATERIRHAIRLGRYQPGTALKQNDIAKDLGLSSTPVREALSELCASGLVVYEQHRGNRVSTLDIKRIESVYEARKVLEKETAKLAYKNISLNTISELSLLNRKMSACLKCGDIETLMIVDETFHQRIFDSAHNEFLVTAIDNLWKSFPRYFMWNIEERMVQSMSEHKEMVIALKDRDRTRFIRGITDHLDNSLITIRHHFQELS